jgi:hypothetical protein
MIAYALVPSSKNSLTEVSTWEKDFDGESAVLTLERNWTTGSFTLYYPENKTEEAELLAEIWGDPTGKHYPPLPDENTPEIDLSDFRHDMNACSLGADVWSANSSSELIKENELGGVLSQVEALDPEEAETYLEQNEWELDLQYFRITGGAVLTPA